MEHLIAEPPAILKLAGHPVRWNLLKNLALSDERVQDLVALLQLPQNLISYHLRLLREGRLVTERRSGADERAVYYSLDIEQLQRYFLDAGESLHPAIIESVHSTSPEHTPAPHPEHPAPPLRVLFLCTENSARSQMAEALLRHLSRGTIEAYSAGSFPAGQIHPLASRYIEQVGIDMSQQYPKHFKTFIGQHFDAIVTVCDRMRESCPTFPDDPLRIHWSFPDPASLTGPEEEQYHTFEQIGLQLTNRIRLLITLLERERRQKQKEREIYEKGYM
ncbi:MAG: ArsR family transcriptional regulator [Ktedonobacteraceae bacterium]|nr:ArsR family transcriptional regulator [Ktedonobacteraceae bacterium]